MIAQKIFPKSYLLLISNNIENTYNLGQRKVVQEEKHCPKYYMHQRIANLFDLTTTEMQAKNTGKPSTFDRKNKFATVTEIISLHSEKARGIEKVNKAQNVRTGIATET